MGGRFMRGLLWGGLVGAAVGLYLFSGARDGGPGRLGLRRWRRAGQLDGEGPAAVRPSRLRLAWDAGKAAMEATLALLGRRA